MAMHKSVGSLGRLNSCQPGSQMFGSARLQKRLARLAFGLEPSRWQHYMMEPHRRGEDGSPIFDNLDIDLFVKVLANTAFSENYLSISAAVINQSLGPFFVFFIPIFYIIQGTNITDPIIIVCSIYYAFVSAFCRSRSPAYRFM